jgi:putative addiction module killer protein
MVQYMLLCAAMIELREYVDGRGRVPFREWLRTLDRGIRAKLHTVLTRIALGNLSNAKGVGGGVLEYKANFGPGYRIYFASDGKRLVILLGGGTKRRQHFDIETAIDRWNDYKKSKLSARRPDDENTDGGL